MYVWFGLRSRRWPQKHVHTYTCNQHTYVIWINQYTYVIWIHQYTYVIWITIPLPTTQSRAHIYICNQCTFVIRINILSLTTETRAYIYIHSMYIYYNRFGFTSSYSPRHHARVYAWCNQCTYVIPRHGNPRICIYIQWVYTCICTYIQWV